MAIPQIRRHMSFMQPCRNTQFTHITSILGEIIQWTDGTDLDYQNWSPGQPDDHKGIEECGEIWTSSMEWNDLACDSRKGYICAVKKCNVFPCSYKLCIYAM